MKGGGTPVSERDGEKASQRSSQGRGEGLASRFFSEGEKNPV